MEKVVPVISSVFIVLIWKANQWDGFYVIVNGMK